MTKRVNKKFIWVDMEMTGLNPDRDKILEISMIVTDTSLKIIDKFSPITIGHKLKESDFHFGGNKKVREQLIKAFKKSGLLDRVANSNATEEDAERLMLERIKEYCFKGKCHIAGSSVWRDVMFIQKYLPKVWDYVHYRLLDVSCIKTLREQWYSEIPEYPKKELHDATEDILESLEQLKYYREKLFK